MCKLIIILFTLGYVANTVRANLDIWHDECPFVCTCHLSDLNELPVVSLMRQTKLHMKTKHNVVEEKETQLHKNEVFEEDDLQMKHVEDRSLLSTAMCVMGVGMEIQSLLFALPSNLQVLIIMQGSNSENITLEMDHFSNLQNLVGLEIHGFHRVTANTSGVLSLRQDVFRQLHLLKYLNLEHVHLIGQKEQDNIPHVPIPPTNFMYQTNEELPNSIPLINQDNNQFQIFGQLDHQLKFLSEPSDSKILPYEVYQTNQEYASLFTFSGLHQLKILRIFHCNVKLLRWEMFDGLQNLEELSLEGNLLLFLPDFSFYGTPSLKYLCLSHNNLLNIKSTGLIGLLQLELLDISYNNISHLSELSLPPFPNLKSADFHHNPLEMIIPHTFDMMNITEELYVGGYSAPLEIQPNSFHGLQNILKLGMTNVKLRILEKNHLTGMPKLKELKIQGKINKITFDAFIEVNKLEVLVLKNCSLHLISMDTFYGLNDLIYLDLSNNLLESIPTGSFDHLNSLRELSLRNNRLTKLPFGIFPNSLQMIRLDKNPWHCTCRFDEWNPYVTNKIKKRILNNPKCQFRFDKGSMCDLELFYQYVYEKKVTPQCASPRKYKGWSVFHVLRKILRCVKKQEQTKEDLYLNKKINVNDDVKAKKIVQTKKYLKSKNIGNITDSLNLTSTSGFPIVNSKQDFGPKEDINNELSSLNVFGIHLEETTNNQGGSDKINQELSNTMTWLKQFHEVTSETANKFIEPSKTKLSQKLKFKDTYDVQEPLKTYDEKYLQIDKKLQDKNYKISDKPIKKGYFVDQDAMKANKVKALNERFKEKLYKTIHKEKLKNI